MCSELWSDPSVFTHRKHRTVESISVGRKHTHTHTFSPILHPPCDTLGAGTGLLKMNIKTGLKNAVISQWFRDMGNIRRMRETKWVPCGRRQIPALTVVVMVQSQDQNCCSSYWDKWILIAHMWFSPQTCTQAQDLTLHAVWAPSLSCLKPWKSHSLHRHQLIKVVLLQFVGSELCKFTILQVCHRTVILEDFFKSDFFLHRQSTVDFPLSSFTLELYYNKIF